MMSGKSSFNCSHVSSQYSPAMATSRTHIMMHLTCAAHKHQGSGPRGGAWVVGKGGQSSKRSGKRGG